MGKLGSKKSRNFKPFNFSTSNYKKKVNLLRHLKQSKFKLSKDIVSDIAIESNDNESTNTIDSHNISEIWRRSGFSSSPPPPHKSDHSNVIYNSEGMHSRSKEKNDISTTARTTQSGSQGSNEAPNSKLTEISNIDKAGLKEYYDLIINSAAWKNNNMNMKPGDDFYLFWFVCSSTIPLICSCTGPLSNIFSLLAIICPWKVHKIRLGYTKDPPWCYGINSLSIVFGIVSNLFLFLNYRKKIRYSYAQIISISGWGIASFFLTALLIGYHAWFHKTGLDRTYDLGEGFYFACIAVILHFANHVLLLINELGFLLKKYKPLFNIDKVQETLIIQTVAMCVWLMIGASVFTRVLDLSLSDSMLYCITSVTTIGTQNVVADTNYLGQTLTSIWIVCGLVMFGLIITSIGRMTFNFSKMTLAWHRMEVLRKIVYKAHENDNPSELSNSDSFNLIKKINKWAFQIQGIYEVASALAIFMLTLMCGAMAFSLLEPWSYRFSVYFCFFNLMTLGLGIESPTTPGGKAIFCAWAIAAVPVMTILVSTTSDFVFSKLTKIEKVAFFELFVDFCLSKKYLRRLGKALRKKENVYVDMPTIETMRTKSLFTTHDEEHPNIEIAGKERMLKVPILCHPADMLYKLIIDGDSYHSYGFVTHEMYVDSAINTIHLANYFREDMYIAFPNDELYEQRLQLGKNLKALDPSFDTDLYIELYNIHPMDADKVGVIQDGNRIQTKFKKKNDFVLDQLSRLQVVQLELRRTVMDMCIAPNKKYNYEEWQTLLNLTNQSVTSDSNLFWLNEDSPLAAPLEQPKYFTMHYLRHLQELLENFSVEWDNYEE